MTRLRTRPFPELTILLLAAITRCWRLDYHSFWFDEAVSLRWAASDPRYTWEVTLQLVQEKHPPGYYLLLHAWQVVGGWFGLAQNELWLRSLGSLLGVLTVLGMLLLATRLSGRTTGLLAGALVALSPVLVWYSQELRMFQPAAMLLVWAAYALVRAWTAPAWRTRWYWWLAMIVAFQAAFYSYLFSAFMLPAAGVALVGWWLATRNRDRQTGPSAPATTATRRTHNEIFGEGFVALNIAGLLFLPLARNAWAANSSEGTPGQAFMNFGANLVHQLQISTVWRVDWSPLLLNAALIFLGVLFLAGLFVPWRKGARSGPPVGLDMVMLWAWLGAPLLVGNLLLSRNDSIFAEDRYFLFLGPFVLWALARGAVASPGWLAGRGRRAQILTVATGGMTLLLLALALPRLWTPAMLREDWRAASEYVLDYQAASPELPAAVVAHVDYVHLAPQWYLRRATTQEELPLYYPFGGPLGPEQVDSEIAPPLRGIEESGAATLWLLQSHLDGVDEGRLVESWLNQNYPLVTEQYPAGVKLSGYALQNQFTQLPPLPATAQTQPTELAPGLQLAACEILTPQLPASDERMHPPSGWVHVRLWWTATGPIADDYIASVQMVGPEGVWGDRLYRANETLRRTPTSDWTPGVYWRDEVDVNLNPVTPPGAYPIVVRLRDSQDQPLPVSVECGRVMIEG